MTIYIFKGLNPYKKNYRGLFLLLQNVIPRLSPNRLPTFPWISCKYCHFKQSHSLCTRNQHCIRLVRDRCYWFARTGVIISIAQRYWVKEVCWVGIMDEWEGTCLTKESQQLLAVAQAMVGGWLSVANTPFLQVKPEMWIWCEIASSFWSGKLIFLKVKCCMSQ